MAHHTTSPTTTVLIFVVVALMFIINTVVMRRKGYSSPGEHTIVRCSKGHLFTTVWLPGGSLKAIRLGWARFQYCPVGKHWSLVVPVKESELSDEQKRTAAEHHDARIP